MIHVSPIDKLIAKNQQKMKRNTNKSSVKKPYLSKQENDDKQYKSMKTSGDDDTSESVKIAPPSRYKKKNWSEKFQERRRSRRLSQLPPIEDIKKEVVNEEFCESYDEKSYNIISDNIKEEKDLKTEIVDCTSDNDTYPYGLKVEDDSNLASNISTDPNELSNHYLPQRVEFTEENNDIFENTTDGSLNIFTYTDNNYPPTCEVTGDNWNSVVNQVTDPATTDNEPTGSNLVISQVWCSEIPNDEQTNFNLAVEGESSSESEDDRHTNLNVVLKRELAREKLKEKKQANMKGEYFLEMSDNELDFNDYTYDNTNIYDTPIEEPDRFTPKILECWSYQTSEKHIYSEMNQTQDDEKEMCENTVLEKSLPVQNSDLNANEAVQCNNNSDKAETINSTSPLKPQLKSRVVAKPGRPRGKARSNNPIIYKHILPKVTIPPVKIRPVIKNLLPYIKPSTPEIQQIEPIKTIEKPVLLEINTEENINSVPLLQRNYSDLTVKDKLLYRAKLNYINTLGLVSIHLCKKKQKEKETLLLKNNWLCSKIAPKDDGNYTDRKYFRTSSDKIRRSYLLEYANNETNTKHVAVPILIPEKSLGSSFHPGRACMNKCSICHGIYGTLDTPCHLAQIKNLDKQKLCLDQAPHLVGPSSCLCETCFRSIQKKCAKACLPKNVCMIMSCQQPATKQYNSNCIETVKSMIIKRGANIRSWANSLIAFPTCEDHHEEILKVTQCQLCGNRTPHKVLVPRSEVRDFQTIIDRIQVPHTLDNEFFICKACHVYLLWTSHLMTSTMDRPKNIRKHCNDVLKRICLHHGVDLQANRNKAKELNALKNAAKVISVQPNTANKIPGNNDQDPKTNVYKRPTKATSTITSAAYKNNNNSNNCQTINFPVCSQAERSDMYFVSEVKEPVKPVPQHNLKKNLQPKPTVTNNRSAGKLPTYVPVLKPADTSKLPPFDSNMNMATLKSRTVEDNLLLPNLPELEDFYTEEEEAIEVKVSANVFKIFQELQKPYGDSAELFNQLLMFENCRMQGDLVVQNRSPPPLALRSTTKNPPKSMYDFPQMKSELMSSDKRQNLVEARPISTNTITPMTTRDNDGRIIKKPKNMNDPLNSNSKIEMKPHLQIPSKPVQIPTIPSNKFITIPLSVVANGVICKPLEIYNSEPNNQNVLPCETTMDSFDTPKLILTSTNRANKNVTTAAKCVKVTSFKNVPMKRVYPINVQNNVINVPSIPNFKPVPSSTLKNLRVVRTTKQLTPEELRMARANASANASALLKMGFIQKP